MIMVFYVGAVVYGAWAAKRDKVSNRYVLTDRRAAVFRVPSQLLAQVGVQGAEFEVIREPDASVGTLRWGESDPLGAAIQVVWRLILDGSVLARRKPAGTGRLHRCRRFRAAPRPGHCRSGGMGSTDA